METLSTDHRHQPDHPREGSIALSSPGQAIVRVLEVDPELAAELDGDRREQAVSLCVGIAFSLRPGRWPASTGYEHLKGGFGLLVEP